MDDVAAALARHQALVRGLCRPEAWPQTFDGAAEVIETHLSSVVLAGAWALKVKKPLALDFVDFSTLERRRHFCDEELRLNRRTAAAWYVDVLPVTGSVDAPRLGGAGAPIEWALRMRRFDQALLLDRLAADGRLDAPKVDAFAQAVAAFHAALPASPACHGDPATALHYARGNLHALAQAAIAPDAVAALHRWTEQRFAAVAPLLARRRAQGRVREGHGDLHLGNVAWLDGAPVPFDALEFEPLLRHLDTASDAAFAFMDLLDHGLPALAWRWLSGYLEAGGDHDALPAWRWFAVYRALVRAKVAAIRAAQPGVAAAEADAARAAAQRRVDRAARLARLAATSPAVPTLVLTTGLSGSGKSTVAQTLVEALGAVRVRSDVERKRLHGLAPTARGDPASLYTAAATRRTYARLADVARAAIAGEIDVVVDAAFLRRAERDAMRALARALGARCVVVDCRAPRAVLEQRLEARSRAGTDASDATVDVLALQWRVPEPIAGDEAADAHVLDTDAPPDVVRERVQALAHRLAGR